MRREGKGTTQTHNNKKMISSAFELSFTFAYNTHEINTQNR